MKVVFVLILIFSSSVLFGQNKTEQNSKTLVDSLTSKALENDLQSMENMIESLDLFYQAFDIIQNDPKLSEARALLYFQYHNFLYKTGNYKEAIQYGEKLVALCENPNYNGHYYYVYQNLGKLYLKLGQVKDAIKIEKRGIDFAIKNKNSPKLDVIYFYMYNELGLTFLWSGQYENAILYFDKALNSDWEFNAHFTFVLKENKADALIKNGDLYSARALLNDMEHHPGRKEHIRREINYLILEAEYAIAVGSTSKTTQFIRLAEKTLSNSSESQDPSLWRRILNLKLRYNIVNQNQKAISLITHKIQNFNDSLEWIHQQNTLISKNRFYKKAIENKDLKLANEQLKVKNRDQRIKKEVLSNKNKTLNIIIISLSSVILLILVAAIYRKRSQMLKTREAQAKKKTEEANQKLEQSIEEKKSLQESLKHKDMDISSLSNHLKNSSSQISELRKILKQINSLSSPEQKEEILLDYIINAKNKIRYLQNKETLLENIQEINQEFNNKLKSKHPTLTKGDLVLCSYIRLGMTNQEIADEKNTSLNTIKTAKSRLKKKLKLQADVKLDNYLSTV